MSNWVRDESNNRLQRGDFVSIRGDNISNSEKSETESLSSQSIHSLSEHTTHSLANSDNSSIENPFASININLINSPDNSIENIDPPDNSTVNSLNSHHSFQNMSKVSTITNPFSQPLDLTTKEGMALFKIGCEGLKDDDKYDGNKANGKVMKQHLQIRSNKHCWGDIIGQIEDSKGVKRNLLEESHALTQEDVTKHSQKIWSEGKTDFKIDENVVDDDGKLAQKRIKSAMIAQFVQNSMTTKAFLDLQIHKKKFEFKYSSGLTENCGLLIIYFLFEDIDPDTRVGTQTLTDDLEALTLAEFDDDIVKMFTSFETLMHELELREDPYKKPVPLLLDILVEHKNEEFVKCIRDKRDEYDEGKDYTVAELMRIAKSKLNNIESRRKRQERRDKRSPSTPTVNSNLVTLLTTLLTQQQAQPSASSGPPSGSYPNSSSAGSGFTTPGLDLAAKDSSLSVDVWRTKNIGDTVFVNGVQWWWCPHHKFPGKFDGLYMKHQPGSGHEAWEAKKDRMRKLHKEARRNASGGSSGSSSAHKTEKTKDEGPRLQISDQVEKLKSALVSDLGASELQAELFMKNFQRA